ncbi:MAG: SRPBCC family protein [Solirubrobacterales bacterium]
MSAWREQALIDAPVEEVWKLIGDPNRHPEWWPLVVQVDDLHRIEQDATYRQVTVNPRGDGTMETTFKIEHLEDMREITTQCQDTGMWANWRFTEAQNETFAELEIGFESDRLELGVLRAPLAKRYLRRFAEESLEGLRKAVAK